MSDPLSGLSGIAADPLLLSAMAALAEPQFRKGWVDPSKQSVAVLPFQNLSSDGEQEYFADGITEDIITELARYGNLFIASRNSSFHFKGRTGLVQQIGQELGVNYVVEGSVRRAGNKVRITSQLIYTATGGQLWAERFDRDLDDIFAVQDEVVRAIAVHIPGTVERQVLEGARRKLPENLNSYECELRGRWAFNHWSEGVEEAIRWFERAVDADPHYATALARLARCYVYSTLVVDDQSDDARSKSLALIDRAIALDPRNPVVLSNAAAVYLAAGSGHVAREVAARACEMNPNDPSVLNIMALVLTYTGEPEEALHWHARSEKIEHYASDDQRLDILCDTYYTLRQYDKVIQIHRGYRNAPPGIRDVLAAALAQSGHIEDAIRTLKENEDAGYSAADSLRSVHAQMRHCIRSEDRDHWLEGYRKAGLPI